MAIVLYLLGAFHGTRHFAVRVSSVLCPEMILGLGLGDPPSGEAVLLLLAWVFATNFLLYGFFGSLMSFFFRGRRGSAA